MKKLLVSVIVKNDKHSTDMCECELQCGCIEIVPRERLLPINKTKYDILIEVEVIENYPSWCSVKIPCGCIMLTKCNNLKEI